MLRKMNGKRLVWVGVLLATAGLCTSNPGRNLSRNSAQRPHFNGYEAQQNLRKNDQTSAERIQLAQRIIQDIQSDTKTILNPVVRIRIRMLVADAYWSFQPEKARAILSEEFPKIALITPPQNEDKFGKIWSQKDQEQSATYKGVAVEQVKAQLRREIIAIISSHDPALARELIATEKKKDKKDDHEEEKTDEVLATVSQLAETDPRAAARILSESVNHGPGDAFAFLLIRLRDTAPGEASALFNQVLANVKAKEDLWGLERLVPFILPTELDRLVGGKHYLTDPQRMKDANALIAFAAELLYRRIQVQHPGQIAPDTARREYYLWRNLQGLFNDLRPECVWLINMRLRQLTQAFPQQQGQTQGPWSEERLKKLISAAEASSGDQRDEYLNNAAFNAWRFGQGDLDQAIALAEKITSAEMRDLTLGTLYYQAGLKSLRSEGPDAALNLARKIEPPGIRTRLYLSIIRTLSSIKAAERIDTLREELLQWMGNRDRTSETAWALLDYLEGSTNGSLERDFAALEILIRVLNSPSLDPDSRLKNKIYWQPDFHDFRKSLMPLAKADFDKGLQVIQMLNNREIFMQIQAAFCSSYLKMHKQTISVR